MPKVGIRATDSLWPTYAAYNAHEFAGKALVSPAVGAGRTAAAGTPPDQA
jgi:hypothetical protein